MCRKLLVRGSARSRWSPTLQRDVSQTRRLKAEEPWQKPSCLVNGWQGGLIRTMSQENLSSSSSVSPWRPEGGSGQVRSGGAHERPCRTHLDVLVQDARAGEVVRVDLVGGGVDVHGSNHLVGQLGLCTQVRFLSDSFLLPRTRCSHEHEHVGPLDPIMGVCVCVCVSRPLVCHTQRMKGGSVK